MVDRTAGCTPVFCETCFSLSPGYQGGFPIFHSRKRDLLKFMAQLINISGNMHQLIQSKQRIAKGFPPVLKDIEQISNLRPSMGMRRTDHELGTFQSDFP